MAEATRTMRNMAWQNQRRKTIDESDRDIVATMAGLREGQLRAEQTRLEETERVLLQKSAGQLAEYVTVGNLRGVESLDPARTRPGVTVVPHVVESDRVLADRFRVAARTASWAGIGLATVLGVLTLAAPAVVTLPIGALFMALISGTGSGVMLALTGTNIRDTGTVGRINRLATILGVLLAVGLTAVFAMRFVPNIATLELIGLPLTLVEITLLGLAGLFIAAETYYSWSIVITAQYDDTMAKLVAVRTALARVGVDLMELQFQLEAADNLRTSDASAPPVTVSVPVPMPAKG